MANIEVFEELKKECEKEIADLRKEQDEIREELLYNRAKQVIYNACLSSRYRDYYDKKIEGLQKDEDELEDEYNNDIAPEIKRLEYELEIINSCIRKLN